MTNDNRKVGTSFERKLCLILSEHGFWCHNLAQNSQGQPFDVIAARNGKTYPIDCKVCSNNLFKLERVETNSVLSEQELRLLGGPLEEWVRRCW